MRPPSIYSINPGQNFALALARGVMQMAGDDPAALPHYRILLPTRRAGRALRDAFLSLTDGRPLMLPRLHPIGDIEEEELILSFPGLRPLDIPPAISPMQRQILLARMITAMPEYKAGHDQAIALAAALGRFMDETIIHDVDMQALHTLVPEDFAGHWQITIDFLKLLSEYWPKILAEAGVIDAADRRSRLIRALAAAWEGAPPDMPVIAAGSTGTMPATAALLRTVATLPRGYVVLPGLDQEMEEESWRALNSCHPQAALKALLERTFGVNPQDIKPWPGQEEEDTSAERRMVLREMMRPGETAGQWRRIDPHAVKAGLDGVQYYVCDTPQQEAQVISLILREAMEIPGKTAALVTPDRDLARRVMSCCRKWGIEVDDSGGTPLPLTYRGRFLMAILKAVERDLSPAALLCVLRHGLCAAGGPHSVLFSLAAGIERKALRGLATYTSLEELARSCPSLRAEEAGLLYTLHTLFTPLTALAKGGAQGMKDWLAATVALAEALCTTDETPGQEILWAQEDGESAATLFAELMDLSALFPPIGFAAFQDILTRFCGERSVRTAHGTHTRLMILGQLEARLVQADVMILSGLNEGKWPPDIRHDTWMSRPMRKAMGIPDADMRTGQSAHDFALGFCAPQVILTRSRKEEGKPAKPARWIERLSAVMTAAGLPLAHLDVNPYPALAMTLRTAPDVVTPAPRPAPRPPRSLRPKKLPVTAIETWMRDPYAIYAKYILNLRKLDDLEQEMDAAQRGTLLHAALKEFISAYPHHVPPDSAAILKTMVREKLGTHPASNQFWGEWEPRLDSIAQWFVQHERDWRRTATPLKTEIAGSFRMAEPDFTLTATADRIDRMKDGSLVLIDYKTGAVPSAKDVINGHAPQLPLEGAIAHQDGFPGLEGARVSILAFWELSGGKVPGEEKQIKPPKGGDIAQIIETAHEGLRTLVTAFDAEGVPYFSLPRADKSPRFQDYAHLARVQEWAALDDDQEEDAA